MHTLDLAMRLQVFSHTLGGGILMADPQRQGLQAALEQKGLMRVDDIAKDAASVL